MQVESLKLMLSERDKENKSLRGEMNDQEVYQLKHERVTSQYEQLIQSLEHENETLKSVKDE
jgi:hypothetical protein